MHLSAGDLLREERQRKDSEVGQLIEGHIRNGTIVPVEITCGLLGRVIYMTVFYEMAYNHTCQNFVRSMYRY